jgi:hypothetical protein
MLIKNNCKGVRDWRLSGVVALLVMAASSCSREAPKTAVKTMPANQEFSGFLSSYANLKPNPNFDKTLSWVSGEPDKNIHRYVAMIVDPPAIYVSTDAAEKAIPDRGAAALRDYFQQAVTNAVADAFPVVQSSGPLVLRLRSAIVGIDVGQQAQAADQKDGNTLERPVNIGKVGVEMELVDSETGQQIAAVVDRQNLGEGAVIGSVNFSREEKFRAATEAFDGWASRLRQFLDSAHELSKDDVARTEASNSPYE